MSKRALWQLSRLLHPAHYRRRWLAMIEAYIDESGTHEQAKIVVMAGFLSSYKRWRKFDGEWDAVLNPADEINPPEKRRVFHATDCLGKDGYKDFAGWPKSSRDGLVERLIPIVRKRTLFSFASAFALDDYNTVVPEWIRNKWKHPYYVCMFHTANLLKVNRSKFSFPPDEKIAFIFGHKPKFVGLLAELYDEMRAAPAISDILGKMTPYGTPKEDIPIQAADLLCYLVRTFWEKDYLQPDSAHPRTLALLRELAPGNHLESHFLGRDGLEAFARAYADTHKELGYDWSRNAKKS